MPALAPPLRTARPGDAAVLATLVNAAGEGLPLHLWTGMAGQGDDPWEIGAARQRMKIARGSIWVVDEGAGPVAGLTGYAIPGTPAPIPDDMPAIFRAMQELEDLAPGSWYVNVLATLPDHRGRGHGSRLLELAHSIAAETGCRGLSIIVADSNDRARRLYARHGYAETARRPVIRDGWETGIANWLLLTRPL